MAFAARRTRKNIKSETDVSYFTSVLIDYMRVLPFGYAYEDISIFFIIMSPAFSPYRKVHEKPKKSDI